ncbi:hypothetical protein F7725_027408 [Dissostichus mawsoni]|uniref:Cyclin-dependent kinases regulatory subunit n=1 Tax=Dissostichus mawsoni TaxID=36200 RepID=A0A7J5XCW5_DISMA|nr:hypothetical protein F7725_027408 [Dissostichus mawsoni]
MPEDEGGGEGKGGKGRGGEAILLDGKYTWCCLDQSASVFFPLENCFLGFGFVCYHQLNMSKKQIYYSDKYTDEEFEYRHVVLPKQLSKLVPTSHLMTEDEWRGLGCSRARGPGVWAKSTDGPPAL